MLKGSPYCWGQHARRTQELEHSSWVLSDRVLPGDCSTRKCYANLQGREVPKSSDQLWCLWNTIMTRMGRYALRWNRGVVLDDCLIGHTHKGGSHIWYYKICQLLRANKVTDLRGESAVSVLLTTGITNCILKITLMPTGKYNSHPLWKKLLFVSDRDHYRNPHPIKMQRLECAVPARTDTSICNCI